MQGNQRESKVRRPFFTYERAPATFLRQGNGGVPPCHATPHPDSLRRTISMASRLYPHSSYGRDDVLPVISHPVKFGVRRKETLPRVSNRMESRRGSSIVIRPQAPNPYLCLEIGWDRLTVFGSCPAMALIVSFQRFLWRHILGISIWKRYLGSIASRPGPEKDRRASESRNGLYSGCLKEYLPGVEIFVLRRVTKLSSLARPFVNRVAGGYQ
ncbi:hypothetical protein BDW02DRAFT_326825 [Decorospora gaudefroyi]|uniref:Uncharacterized protein n=1 Tax=Decorospora gaudefroyi TaxID=184978 RepID=A0A6A5KGU1_9PLEO|nr:hypothetical protein BDW02DRAFT_326825 [Decorospora gaudefroyi]